MAGFLRIRFSRNETKDDYNLFRSNTEFETMYRVYDGGWYTVCTTHTHTRKKHEQKNVNRCKSIETIHRKDHRIVEWKNGDAKTFDSKPIYNLWNHNSIFCAVLCGCFVFFFQGKKQQPFLLRFAIEIRKYGAQALTGHIFHLLANRKTVTGITMSVVQLAYN